MATTDQLRKAERRQGLTLNAFSRDRYIRELEAIGQTNLRRLSKAELFKRVLAADIQIRPDWAAQNAPTACGQTQIDGQNTGHEPFPSPAVGS